MTVRQVWESRAGSAAEVREEVRASVVASVVAGLQAAQLSMAEYLAVVGEILATLARAETERPAIAVAACGVVQGKAELFASVLESRAPVLVASTADLLVRCASPELWAQVRGALEASDEDLRAMIGARDRRREAGN